MTEPNVEDFLEHFGVKGMRWGHRKGSDTSSTPNKKQVKKANLNDAYSVLNKTYSDSEIFKARQKSEKMYNDYLEAGRKYKTVRHDPEIRKQTQALVDRLATEYNTSDARIIAAKATSGEKMMMRFLDPVEANYQINAVPKSVAKAVARSRTKNQLSK